MKRRYTVLTLFLLFALILSACSMPGASSWPNTKAPAQTPRAQEMPTPTVPTNGTNGANGAKEPPIQTSAPQLIAGLEETLSHIYEEVNPSVVHIKVVKAAPPNPFTPQPQVQKGVGSGIVWDKEGHIVTNNHVVEGADHITVTFADGTQAEAELMGTDPDSDLAVIKVNVPADQLHPIRVGDSTRLKVGQLAIAIGNPFALSGTMTVGIISALGRVLPTEDQGMMGIPYAIPDIIQTDAPINPGNSGGALLNSKGELIGVTTAILSPVRASVGIGFAIPSVIVQKVVPQLIEKGHYEHPWLGILIETLTPEIAKAMGLPEDQRGVLILQVTPDSPADKAGLRGSDRRVTVEIDGSKKTIPVGGDVIIAIDGHPVRTGDDLLTYLARYTEVGQTVTLTILRDGKKMDVKVTLAARPTHERQGPKEMKESARAWLGIVGLTVTPELAKKIGLPEDQGGVLIEGVIQGSPADKAGLRGSYKPIRIGQEEVLIGGDVILAFDGKPVTSIEDLLQYLEERKPGDTVTLTIWRNGEKMDVKVTLGERPKD
ncbi:MAG: PDZ domain-containing protein [Chloroflexi bacterium]|nr:PDZ domain-containing protein [Chloroflexota bacterium]